MTTEFIAYYDLREEDMAGNKISDEYKTCDRCGRKHSKVFIVKINDKMLSVGKTCCKKLLGWTLNSTQIHGLRMRMKNNTNLL